MVGPFKTARGGMTHLLVAVDKFTKWIEARPIKKLDGSTAVRFIKDITVRYGVLHSIITDKGTNFAKGALAQYCSISGIQLDLASVAHPQSNGMVERANGLILAGIKPRLVELLVRSPGSWLHELPTVLWSLRTTPNRSTGFTPFFLVYGAEAIIPTDIEFDSPRVTMYTEPEAKEAREDGVDLLEEACLLALSRSAIYQQCLRHYHSKKIKPLAFREGNLVLRLVQRTAGQHKLASPWEGPFIISKVLCDRNAYYLIDARKQNTQKRHNRRRDKPALERGAPPPVLQLAGFTYVPLPFGFNESSRSPERHSGATFSRSIKHCVPCTFMLFTPGSARSARGLGGLPVRPHPAISLSPFQCIRVAKALSSPQATHRLPAVRLA
ncbi:hypothetical protein ACQJBY_019219 [Aegilops geniculata]